nr:stage II sporulation protein R [Clostridia bacterium]
MKRFDFFLAMICLVLGTALLVMIPTEAEAAIYEDTVRLHIRADGDDEEAQEIKLEIRDRLLAEYSSILGGSLSKKEAEGELLDRLSEIEADIEGWLSELGAGYGATVRLGTEWFDTRKYEGFTLPKGYYTSLIVELGSGEGKNWWCVMFPPMCLELATERVEYTERENELVAAGRYSVRFKLLELVSEICR